MQKIFLRIIGMGIILSSCGNPASDLANDMCDCVDEMGLTNPFNVMSGVDVDPEEHECTKDVAGQLVEELKDKDKDERVAFMQDLSKALIDTECGEDALGMIPYDEMLERIEKGLDGNVGGSGFGKPDICDCLEAARSGDDPDFMEECEKAYKDMDHKELEQMMEECGGF